MKSSMQQVGLGGAMKNDLWITDLEELSDPSPLPDLPGFHVLVRPISVKSVTKGGIFIRDLAYMDKDKFPAGAWCNVGDYVCYGKHAGTKLFYKGVRLILLFDDQIIMKVEDPKDLDPTFNLGKGSS